MWSYTRRSLASINVKIECGVTRVLSFVSLIIIIFLSTVHQQRKNVIAWVTAVGNLTIELTINHCLYSQIRQSTSVTAVVNGNQDCRSGWKLFFYEMLRFDWQMVLGSQIGCQARWEACRGRRGSSNNAIFGNPQLTFLNLWKTSTPQWQMFCQLNWEQTLGFHSFIFSKKD